MSDDGELCLKIVIVVNRDIKVSRSSKYLTKLYETGVVWRVIIVVVKKKGLL